MFRLMITAASSNSGKTAVTCGLLSLLKKRGLDPCAFKCGPDYIDPMFHRTVLGIPSNNLDVFLAGEDGIRDVFSRNSKGHGAAVCEGVMGFYDGIRYGGRSTGAAEAEKAADDSETGKSDYDTSMHTSNRDDFASAHHDDFASAHHVADLLDLPAILVVRPKGTALTLAAVIRGVSEFREPQRICGVIFNDCSEMYCRMYGPQIERESGIPVLGYVPHMEEANFESRHLGLMTAEEIGDLAQRIDRIGQKMEETIDVERLFEVVRAASTEEVIGSVGDDGIVGAAYEDETIGALCEAENADIVCESDNARGRGETGPAETDPKDQAADRVSIAVAKDEAFNFFYAETITALEQAGAEIRYFSPVHDEALPEGVQGLYLPGGYPELYGQQLSANKTMLQSIHDSVTGGLPTIAECGGFLYLCASLEDAEGHSWPMAAVFPGHARNAGKLVRFGYGHISMRTAADSDESAGTSTDMNADADAVAGSVAGSVAAISVAVGETEDSMLLREGEKIPVHEFHYWDTTANGTDMTLTKISNGRQWDFGYASKTLYAGFPHLYLAGGELAQRFITACRHC